MVTTRSRAKQLNPAPTFTKKRVTKKGVQTKGKKKNVQQCNNHVRPFVLKNLTSSEMNRIANELKKNNKITVSVTKYKINNAQDKNLRETMEKFHDYFDKALELEKQILMTQLTDKQQREFTDWVCKRVEQNRTFIKNDKCLTEATQKIVEYNNVNAPKVGICPNVSTAKSLSARIVLKQLTWFLFKEVTLKHISLCVTTQPGTWTDTYLRKVLALFTNGMTEWIPAAAQYEDESILQGLEWCINGVARIISIGAYGYRHTDGMFINHYLIKYTGFAKFIEYCGSVLLKHGQTILPTSVAQLLSQMCGIFADQRFGPLIRVLFVYAALHASKPAVRVLKQICTVSVVKIRDSMRTITQCARPVKMLKSPGKKKTRVRRIPL